MQTLGFPGGSEDKVPACNAGDPGWEDHLEKEMAVHSSILAWRIPWREEPGGLQSTGSERVEHNWATSHITHNADIYVYVAYTYVLLFYYQFIFVFESKIGHL